MEVWKMMFLHFGVIFRFQAFGWRGCFSPKLVVWVRNHQPPNHPHVQSVYILMLQKSGAYSDYQASKFMKIPTKIAVFLPIFKSSTGFFYSHRNPGRHPRKACFTLSEAPEECRMSPKESNLPCEEYWNFLVWCLCTTFMTATNRFGDKLKREWVIGWFFGVFNARAQDVLVSKDIDAPSCLGLHVW